MSHTFTKMTTHFVFSTKDRLQMLNQPMRKRLYPYMVKMINNDFGFTREIGGTDDHVHLLMDLNPTISVSDCMRDIKSNSSKWIRRTFSGMDKFNWQQGYGGFSVSGSVVKQVKKYIQNQEEHHRRQSFREEFIALLEKYEVEFDEQCLWK